MSPLRVAADFRGEWCTDNVDVSGITPLTEWSEDLWYAVLGYLNSPAADDALADVSTRFRNGWLGANKQFLDQVHLPFNLADETSVRHWAQLGRSGYMAALTGDRGDVDAVRAKSLEKHALPGVVRVAGPAERGRSEA